VHYELGKPGVEKLGELVSARTTSRSSVGYRTRYEHNDAVEHYAITISALLVRPSAFSLHFRPKAGRGSNALRCSSD
jgi:hypothetical protein